MTMTTASRKPELDEDRVRDAAAEALELLKKLGPLPSCCSDGPEGLDHLVEDVYTLYGCVDEGTPMECDQCGLRLELDDYGQVVASLNLHLALVGEGDP